MSRYAELQVTSNFSFLRGASHPEELVRTAAALGYAALGIADRNTLAGVVRAHVAARQAKLKLLVGARLDLLADIARPKVVPAFGVLCYPTDRAAYGRLSKLLTLGKRRAPKAECRLGLDDLIAHAEGQQLVALPPETPDDAFVERLKRLVAAAPGRVHLAGSHLYRGDDAKRLALLASLGGQLGAPLVAGNDVHAHDPARRPLQDVLTCIREHCTIDQAGFRLFANAERHLKVPGEMARLFRRHPEAIARTVEIAQACRFSLDELRYEYPAEPVPDGRTPQEELERLTGEGAAARYPGGVPAKVQAQLAHELALIKSLDYAPYFLTVHDMVRFARSRGILCQGRGSAANSAVCYCLGITAVDPDRMDLLFERFVSAARNEPPDIDVDFEHERREEVIQYVYEKYGRERAGIAATVISYRGRSAIREVGKALGLSADVAGALAGQLRGFGCEGADEAQVREIGLDPKDARLSMALSLARELIGFPRHLSQHVGGFVITRGPLDEVVPIMNAAMPARTNIEWDKDDLDALRILKVDVLGLGMLTCIRKGLALLRQRHGLDLDLASVPADDPAVYAMLSRGDTIGVFQVESRAQMSMLPRLQPETFYDLVIEIAIVRPGPIQGDMVHPYLRRREKIEQVDYPKEELRAVLDKTLGVPLFQEQAMKIAIVAAGFTPEEADRLRRAMATFRNNGTIHTFRQKMVEGMVARGYERAFAERCFRQIEGFGEYGFPESHAASFALLAYVSSWLKCHYPAAFAAALLNSQPMGFYQPAQLVRDAREHGVTVRGVDVNASDWDCTLEPTTSQAVIPRLDRGIQPSLRNGSAAALDCRVKPGNDERGEGHDEREVNAVALRLGFREVKGVTEVEAARLVAMRGAGYRSIAELQARAGLKRATLEALARADAYGSLGLDRRRAFWSVRALPDETPPLLAAEAIGDHPASAEPDVALPPAALGEEVVGDYASLGLSLRSHPLALLRPGLARRGVVQCTMLGELPAGQRVTVAGLVLVRQRPGTAKGVIFVTLEDETGIANAIIWNHVFERFRRVVLSARLLACRGRLQREGLVIHVVAERLVDLSVELDGLAEIDADRAGHITPAGLRRPHGNYMPKSRDFH
ncbi:MAG: error-prone DNA polymerase [Alphaproteobacteria bacterium]